MYGIYGTINNIIACQAHEIMLPEAEIMLPEAEIMRGGRLATSIKLACCMKCQISLALLRSDHHT